MKKKLYSTAAVRIGTFLGGPAIGGYMISKNYNRCRKRTAARITLLAGIVLTLTIILPFLFIPADVSSKLPGYVIPLLYTIIAHWYVEHYQGPQIKDHLEKGGSFVSNWKAVLLGVLGLVAIVFCIMILIALSKMI
jgi:hypothetical protein